MYSKNYATAIESSEVPLYVGKATAKNRRRNVLRRAAPKSEDKGDDNDDQYNGIYNNNDAAILHMSAWSIVPIHDYVCDKPIYYCCTKLASRMYGTS